MLVFRRPEAADLRHIAAHMRHEDAREVMASHGQPPLQALASSVTASTMCWAGRWAGEPFVLFGYAHHPEGATSVWLLGTDLLTTSPIKHAFLRISRRCTDIWADAFGVLFNFVDERAVTSRRWLRWMGFVEAAPIPYGPLNLPFIPVVKSHV